MSTKLENKIHHLQQVFNVFFAVILFQTISLQVFWFNSGSFLNIENLATSLVFLGTAFYCFWRQLDAYHASLLRNEKVIILGLLRIVLLGMFFVSINSLQSNHQIAFPVSLLALILIALTAIYQFSVVMRPTYGKVRVFIRRELLTDVAIAVFALIFVIVNFFQIDIALPGIQLVYILALLILPKIFAKLMTPWQDPEPPHRGGKGRYDNRGGRQQSSSSRTSRPRQQGARPRPQRPSTGGRPTSLRRESTTRERPARGPSDQSSDRRSTRSSGQQVRSSDEKMLQPPKSRVIRSSDFDEPKEKVERMPRRAEPFGNKEANAAKEEELKKKEAQQAVSTKLENKSSSENNDIPAEKAEQKPEFGQRNTKPAPKIVNVESSEENIDLQFDHKKVEDDDEEQSFGRAPRKSTRR